MANLMNIIPVKTYKTAKNAEIAAEKMYGGYPELRYFIHVHTDGRYFPVFVGMESLKLGVHFNFNIVA